MVDIVSNIGKVLFFLACFLKASTSTLVNLKIARVDDADAFAWHTQFFLEAFPKALPH